MTDQPRMESGYIIGHNLDRIALRIDGDKNRLYFLALLAQEIDNLGHDLKVDGTQVGTVGVAEIDEHEFADETLIGDSLTPVVHQ